MYHSITGARCLDIAVPANYSAVLQAIQIRPQDRRSHDCVGYDTAAIQAILGTL